jgi:cell wall-associated NlpC family hydrolase
MLLPGIVVTAHADGDERNPAAVPSLLQSAAGNVATATGPATALASSATPAAAETPGLVDAVSATMQSAADRMLKSAQGVTDQALDLIGVRYRFGGQTPDSGLDCSGLVRYVFEQVTGVKLPRSARDQAKVGEKVDPDDLQPGDLVFFNTRRAAYSHVGIYVGDNEFVHAPHKKSNVKIAKMDRQYWKKRFNGARRLLGIMPGMVSLEAAKAVLQALPATEQEDPEK